MNLLSMFCSFIQMMLCGRQIPFQEIQNHMIKWKLSQTKFCCDYYFVFFEYRMVRLLWNFLFPLQYVYISDCEVCNMRNIHFLDNCFLYWMWVTLLTIDQKLLKTFRSFLYLILFLYRGIDIFSFPWMHHLCSLFLLTIFDI